MLIEVWSDVVCPWCFIGRRRLQAALAEFGHGDEIHIEHRAFQLQPDAEGVAPTKQHLADKYGVSAEQVDAMQRNVCLIADGEGLCYDLDATLSGNTRDAHRLLLWAQSQGGAEDLLERMYSGYFEHARSLFDDEALLAFVDEAGLDRTAAAVVLASEAFGDEVDEHARLASSFGATGVPFFVFDRKYGISGAQPLEAFTRTLESAWAARD
jgi:predicted DsbA family dithiol-disulfide isomerase